MKEEDPPETPPQPNAHDEGEAWRKDAKTQDGDPVPGAPPPAGSKYGVHEESMTLNGAFFYVVREGKDPKQFENIVCLCPRREDAAAIAAALEKRPA